MYQSIACYNTREVQNKQTFVPNKTKMQQMTRESHHDQFRAPLVRNSSELAEWRTLCLFSTQRGVSPTRCPLDGKTTVRLGVCTSQCLTCFLTCNNGYFNLRFHSFALSTLLAACAIANVNIFNRLSFIFFFCNFCIKRLCTQCITIFCLFIFVFITLKYNYSKYVSFELLIFYL